MSRIYLVLVVTAALSVSACGGSSGGSRSSGGGSGGGILSLILNPTAPSMDMGDSVAVTSLSDDGKGTVLPANATWSVDDPTIASISSTSGTSTLVTGVMEGTTTLRATAGGLTATATVTVGDCTMPADPGPVFGADWTDGIVEYPPMGGGAPTVLAAQATGSKGFVLNQARTHLYIESGAEFFSYEIGTGNWTSVATLPVDPNGYFGLDWDSQGRLYTPGYGTGNIHRIDPTTGVTTDLGGGGAGQVASAVGPDDNVYTSPLASSPGGPWIQKKDTTTGAVTLWAFVPNYVVDLNTFIMPVGVGFNGDGEAYIMSGPDTSIVRHVDANMDGDAFDAGEEVQYATIPSNFMDYLVIGVAVGRCGSALINATPWNTPAGSGVMWIRDINGDDDAADAGEVSLVNTQAVNQGFADPLAARRN